MPKVIDVSAELVAENERMRTQLENIERYALAAKVDRNHAFACGRIMVAASIGLRGHTKGPGQEEPK